jgi:alpha-glucosidase (family GH31 glycosyl hydrolase)
MRKLVVGIGLVCGQVWAQGTPARRANTFELRLPKGSAEVEWVSASTFRFARNWGAPGPAAGPIKSTTVAVTVEDLGARVRFHTRYLTVDVSKDAGRLEIQGNDGPLTTTTVRDEAASVVLESTVAAAERFYGLGSRRTPNLDLRGSLIEATKPFLISSGGYGEYFRAPGRCTFDLASSRPDRRRIIVPGDRVEFFFYYGSTPKEILEEHLGAAGEVEDFGSADLEIRKPKGKAAGPVSWEELRGTVYALQHESLSAMQVASFDLSRYQAAGGALLARAAQLAAFIPKLYASGDESTRAMRNWRARLIPYLVAYGYETRVRGIPLIHPLAMQFPKDAVAARHSDEFMVGDELLVAPVLGPVESVRVYLPQGIWTELRTNDVYKGRQEITVRTVPDEMPVFTRNGTILPLAAEIPGGPMELHYFPKLGAEFFLYEEDLGEISQVHAAPAGEFMRLEIESLQERTYEWIVHHTPVCRKVVLGETELARLGDRARLAPGTWYYDSVEKNLHIMIRAVARGDEIVNISF